MVSRILTRNLILVLRMTAAQTRLESLTRNGTRFIESTYARVLDNHGLNQVMRSFSPNPDLDVQIHSDIPNVFGVIGLAAVYNQPYEHLNDDGSSHMVIVDRGAFDNLDADNVVLRLGGHDDNDSVLASTEAGTLKLQSRDNGLAFVAAIPFDSDVINEVRSMTDCSWSGLTESYWDADGVEHYRSISLDSGDVCLCPTGRNGLTAFGGSEDEMFDARMAKIDAELARHGIR